MYDAGFSGTRSSFLLEAEWCSAAKSTEVQDFKNHAKALRDAKDAEQNSTAQQKAGSREERKGRQRQKEVTTEMLRRNKSTSSRITQRRRGRNGRRTAQEKSWLAQRAQRTPREDALEARGLCGGCAGALRFCLSCLFLGMRLRVAPCCAAEILRGSALISGWEKNCLYAPSLSAVTMYLRRGSGL